MPIKGYYLMPHPPIMISAVGRGEEIKIEKTRTACFQVGAEIGAIGPETVVIISPHGVMFNDAIAFLSGKKVHGDLGKFQAKDTKMSVEIDEDLTKEIQNAISEQGIAAIGLNEKTIKRFGRSFELDHGAFIPLYHLNAYYSAYRLVHITSGLLAQEELYRLGMAIKQAALKLKRKIVLIASGDLSHRLSSDGPYPFSPSGQVFDDTLLSLLQKGDLPGVFKIDKKLIEEAGECGLRSLYVLLGALNSAFNGFLLSYEGTFGVGYGVMKFVPIQGVDDYYSLIFAQQDYQGKRTFNNPFVRLAYQSIAYYLKNNKKMNVPAALPPEFNSQAGVFVSIKKQGALRGCIGTFLPTTQNIAAEIINNAIEAATQDPRFHPIKFTELSEIDLSVDILSKPEPALAVALDPKKYGVIVSKGYRKGLLLPDLEGVDTVAEQLAIACRKAGINPNDDFQIQRFLVRRESE